MCGGGGAGLPEWEPNFPVSAVERKVVDRELKIKLEGVAFDTFEYAIKRYGYIGQVTDTSLSEVSDMINLRADDLPDRNSVVHYYYQAEHGFDHGNYKTQVILVLGFLLCAHKSPKAASESLWGIVNPEIKNTIPKSDVKDLLYNMAAYSIDVPIKYQSFQDTKDQELDDYLEALKSKKDEIIQEVLNRLPSEVTKEDFERTLVRFNNVYNCNREKIGIQLTE